MPLPGNEILQSTGIESAHNEEHASGTTRVGFTPTKKPSSPLYHTETDFRLLAISCNLNKTQRH